MPSYVLDDDPGEPLLLEGDELVGVLLALSGVTDSTTPAQARALVAARLADWTPREVAALQAAGWL